MINTALPAQEYNLVFSIYNISPFSARKHSLDSLVVVVVIVVAACVCVNELFSNKVADYIAMLYAFP